MYTQTVAVRDLVWAVYPSGDLLSSSELSRRLSQGRDVHSYVQSTWPESHRREVSVARETVFEDRVLRVQGRIDGVAHHEDVVLIEEIKSIAEFRGSGATLRGVPAEAPSALHLAQAKIYAAMYAATDAVEIGATSVLIRVTYCCPLGETDETPQCSVFDSRESVEDLERFYAATVDRYVEDCREREDHFRLRDGGLFHVRFPFSTVRPGQKTLATAVTSAATGGAVLFAEAPTGVGKTAAVLYGALKAAASGRWDVLFYLTARTTTRIAAERAAELMVESGASIRSVTLTARDKLCIMDRCRISRCSRAVGYYDRLSAALREFRGAHGTVWDRRSIAEAAESHHLCPFELSLEMCLWADLVICDYNYVYDPGVYLRRFFDASNRFTQETCARSRHVLLVDEAHNLPERVRAMYTACISGNAVGRIRAELDPERYPLVSSACAGVTRAVEEFRERLREDGVAVQVAERLDGPAGDRIEACADNLASALAGEGDAAADEPWYDEVSALLAELRRLDLLSAGCGETHAAIVEAKPSDVTIRLVCLDPAPFIAVRTAGASAVVYFSATLKPLEFYEQVMGAGERNQSVEIPSAFPPDKRLVIHVDSISTRAVDRSKTLKTVVDVIGAATARPGNYLVFVSSYQYMELLAGMSVMLLPGVEVVKQHRDMSEGEREGFLDRFQPAPQRSMVGFAVIAGVFAEGIDLPGDRLSGVCIVGVGLKAFTRERDLVRRHYEMHGRDGFLFAYGYPAANAVLQAAGRVVRSETDRGVVVLVGDRYGSDPYASEVLQQLPGCVRLSEVCELEELMRRFWAEAD